MIDPRLFREDLEKVTKGLANRGSKISVDEIVLRDKKRRDWIAVLDDLKAQRNNNSSSIAVYKKEGKDASELIENTRLLGDKIKTIQDEYNVNEEELQKLYLYVPNLPHASVPVGKNATENVEVSKWGKKPVFNFTPLDHMEIGERLKLFDFKRGAKISGSGFAVFTGVGALLERALIQFFLDTHTRKNGFTEIIPPLLVTRNTMRGTGQIPKLEEDMYKTEDDLFLIPTAEVPLTNLHADETLMPKELPISYAGYTPCFRREAGSWGKDTRGFQRLHQFNKVEMVKIVEPEGSYEVLEELLGYAKNILESLGLHYRVLELCTGDLSFGAAKCYDLEAFSPAAQSWLEVSSVSNFEDFQSRRANIRIKGTGKTYFAHTLNGSGLATPRVLVALLESYQTEEGYLKIPEALRSYMNNAEYITPKGLM